jgi:hypothetical protein
MMKLRRISGQPSETLEGFYPELSTDPEPWAGIGHTVIRLLHHLEQHVPGSDQWAHTAHTTLVLDASDNYETSQVSPIMWANLKQGTDFVISSGEGYVWVTPPMDPGPPEQSGYAGP